MVPGTSKGPMNERTAKYIAHIYCVFSMCQTLLKTSQFVVLMHLSLIITLGDGYYDEPRFREEKTGYTSAQSHTADK